MTKTAVASQTASKKSTAAVAPQNLNRKLVAITIARNVTNKSIAIAAGQKSKKKSAVIAQSGDCSEFYLNKNLCDSDEEDPLATESADRINPQMPIADVSAQNHAEIDENDRVSSAVEQLKVLAQKQIPTPLNVGTANAPTAPAEDGAKSNGDEEREPSQKKQKLNDNEKETKPDNDDDEYDSGSDEDGSKSPALNDEDRVVVDREEVIVITNIVDHIFYQEKDKNGQLKYQDEYRCEYIQDGEKKYWWIGWEQLSKSCYFLLNNYLIDKNEMIYEDVLRNLRAHPRNKRDEFGRVFPGSASGAVVVRSARQLPELRERFFENDMSKMIYNDMHYSDDEIQS